MEVVPILPAIKNKTDSDQFNWQLCWMVFEKCFGLNNVEFKNEKLICIFGAGNFFRLDGGVRGFKNVI